MLLFASTTARSSPALLGWNCGYTIFSNVSGPEATPLFPLVVDRKIVDNAQRAFCCHNRSLSSQPPRHGKRSDWSHDSRFWCPCSFFLGSSHLAFGVAYSFINRLLSSRYTQISILLRLCTLLADWSLLQEASRCYSRSNPGVKHPSNHDLDLERKCELKRYCRHSSFPFFSDLFRTSAAGRCCRGPMPLEA